MSRIPARRLYTFKERLVLKPLTDRLKRLRNFASGRRYAGREPERGDGVLAQMGDVSARPVLFTIAFNLPWAIDLLARTVARHMPDWQLVVVDNSNAPEKRAEIRRVAEAHGLPYLDLPPNPERNPNRSHGLALEWTWVNVIRRARPRWFGFIDHDCFPFEPNDMLERLATRPVDGLRIRPRFVVGAWYVWAGFQFYDMAAVGDADLHFMPDPVLRLDTAGGNWRRFYDRLDPQRLDFVGSSSITVPSIDGTRTYALTGLGRSFLHIGGGSYRSGEESLKEMASARAFVEKSLVDPRPEGSDVA